LALALARAAHRAGDATRREHWLDEASAGEAPESVREVALRIRQLVALEGAHLARAQASLVLGAERATGERKAELLALAGDAARGELSARRDAGRVEADSIAQERAVAELLAAPDDVARARALPDVDLARFSARCAAVEIASGGRTLASFRRDGLAPIPGPID